MNFRKIEKRKKPDGAGGTDRPWSVSTGERRSVPLQAARYAT
jgi:hypothetical protein